MFKFASINNTFLMIDFNDKQISILQIAEKLFAENGFDGTSIRAISKIAKINVAMVSYYFGSKEKLLESLIVFRTADLKIKLENLLQENVDPVQKIHKFIQLYISKIDQNRHFHQILLFEITSNKRAMDFKSFSEIKKANINSLSSIILEGQKLKVFKKDLNIQMIIPTILGTYFYFLLNKPFFSEILSLNSEEMQTKYIQTQLTEHIQQTIKSLLLYES